jgi:Na+-transporting methylmalonyl-CoA/oxaloacetate decarboxylase gamma subunit
MIDWNLVTKIAGGGFGMVFLILALLALLVWVIKLVVGKIVKGEPKK